MNTQRGASKAILGLEWGSNMPFILTPSRFRVERIQYGQAVPFLKNHFAKIYEEEKSSFLAQEYSDAKLRFYEDMGDFFALVDSESQDTIGVFIGNLVDWSSYYIRSCSILPEYQGQGLYQQFLALLLNVLKQSGVQRAEIDVAPSNFGHIHVLNKMQFNITGIQVSERWGSMVHFTRFLSKQHEEVFLDRFCYGVKPQIKKGDI
jgi:ribosomal protein S18 acetylase RimI-like enzyme